MTRTSSPTSASPRWNALSPSVIVTPLALGFGFLVGESQRLERTLGAPLQMLLTVPKSVFLPVFVLMLGIGFDAEGRVRDRADVLHRGADRHRSRAFGAARPCHRGACLRRHARPALHQHLCAGDGAAGAGRRAARPHLHRARRHLRRNVWRRERHRPRHSVVGRTVPHGLSVRRRAACRRLHRRAQRADAVVRRPEPFALSRRAA